MECDEIAQEMFCKDYDECSELEMSDVDEHIQFRREERI